MQPLATANAAAPERISVRKTYKLYIGGEFPRTESGRSYEVFDARGRLLANACRGTRKDIRDAVRAARKAQPGWAKKTAYNRSQILYRIAELMEGRREQFIRLHRDREHERRDLYEKLGRLTQREREVLALLAGGKRAQSVADHFVVSLATVRTQIRAVLTKLEVGSQLEAVALYRKAAGI